MSQRVAFDAVIFDLDGVITKTASVHSRAWKTMFNNYLKLREKRDGEPFRSFSHQEDYLPYVDGKPRYKGVQSFLESRGIKIEFGSADDDADVETACGLGNKKNLIFNEIIAKGGAEVFETSVFFIKELIKNGVRVGVASSSKNCGPILKAAGLDHLFETRVDGVVSAELGLSGKPNPDIFTRACDNLGVKYSRSVVVEDAVSGVQAGRNGNFGLVLGVAREDNIKELKTNGADIVVGDLSEISIENISEWFSNTVKQDSWQINYYDYNKDSEGHREALLSTGNGFFCNRGAVEEAGGNGLNYHATYITGVYNTLKTSVEGKEILNEDLVNCPLWTEISFKIDNEVFDINSAQFIDFKRTLDLKYGILEKFMIVKDLKGRLTKVSSKRFVSMHNPHLAAVNYKILPLNYSAEITIFTKLDASMENKNVARYSQLASKHLKTTDIGGQGGSSYLLSTTVQSKTDIALCSAISLQKDKQVFDPKIDKEILSEQIVDSITVDVKEDEEISLTKFVSIFTNRETKSPLADAKQMLSANLNFEEELNKNNKIWEAIWQKMDVKICGDRLTQKMVHLNYYHLIISNSELSSSWDTGIYARGLTGECYRGHIFWDDVFILPFYCMNFPEVAKGALIYRYKRLQAAREYAKQFGYKGAMFPWHSASTGDEQTQLVHINPLTKEWEPDNTSLQRHVNLAIAYDICIYFNYTQDHSFMQEYGFEILRDICRFWASAASKNQNGKYDIYKVMGPDEFHESYKGGQGLKNNSYTSIMVVWLFEYFISFLEDKKRLPNLQNNLGISSGELKSWEDISHNLVVPMYDSGVIEQFEGYRNLLDVDLDAYKAKYGNIQRMDRILKAEGKSPDDYTVSKQPDVLMAFYILGEEKVKSILKRLSYLPKRDLLKINYDFYKKRTSHGSTLSRIVFSCLAHKLGNEELSETFFQEALTSDYIDIQGGTTKEGIHTGAMGGSVLLILFSYVGLSLDGEDVYLNPQIPSKWDEVSFSFAFRVVRYHLKVSKSKVVVSTFSKEKQKTSVIVKGKKHSLTVGKEKVINL